MKKNRGKASGMCCWFKNYRLLLGLVLAAICGPNECHSVTFSSMPMPVTEKTVRNSTAKPKVDLRTLISKENALLPLRTLPPPSLHCLLKMYSILKDKSTRLHYIDALGKPGPGILKGNLAWQGSFDECLEIKDAKYCIINGLQLANISKFKLSMEICVPKECSGEDVVRGLDLLGRSSVAGHLGKILSKYISFPKSRKDVVCPKKLEVTLGSKITIAIFGVLAALCLLGTTLEILLGLKIPSDSAANKSKDCTIAYERNGCASSEHTKLHSLNVESTIHDDDDVQSLLRDEENVQKSVSGSRRLIRKAGHGLKGFFLCFSLIKSSKEVINMDSPSGTITAINGIRTISMLWVILHHAFLFGVTREADNILDLKSLQRRFTFLPIPNGFLAVDSFFLLSGLLVSYLSLRRFDKLGKLPLIQFYVHRYLRLTPSYGFVILFTTHVLQFFGDGPLWRQETPTLFQRCKDYWWTNILYFNNFYPKNALNECIGWSWFLAADMQFYFISPIILYFMHRFKLLGTIVANGIICIGSFVVTAFLIGNYHFTPARGMIQHETGDPELTFYNVIYTKPYCRIQPYLIGLVLGYILHYQIKPGGPGKWIIVIIGWCCSVVFGLSVTYGTWKTAKTHPQPFSEMENIVYGSFGRFTWGLALAWVIYACHFGYGGLVNKVLSWKGFIPLSRLTYGAYLLNIPVIILYYYTMQAARHYTDLHVSFEYVAITGISYLAAFILAVWIEFPFGSLEKLILQRK